MPHISIKLYPGRSEEVKTRLVEQMVRDITSIANCKEDSVSVAIEEVPPAEWAEKVYKPDIQGNWEKLHKKPGYPPPQ